MKPTRILTVLFVAFALAACGTPRPTCQDSLYGCNGGGARATAAAKPSAAPAPSKPSKPGKPGGHHGGKPGHGKGDGNHGHSGPPGKGGGKGHGKGGHGK